jgi:hypothetical protein
VVFDVRGSVRSHDLGQQTTWVVSLSIAGSEMMTFEKEQPQTWAPINCAMLPTTLAADWWFARCLNLTRIDFDRRLKLSESSGRFRDCCFSGFCFAQYVKISRDY